MEIMNIASRQLTKLDAQSYWLLFTSLSFRLPCWLQGSKAPSAAPMLEGLGLQRLHGSLECLNLPSQGGKSITFLPGTGILQSRSQC